MKFILYFLLIISSGIYSQSPDTLYPVQAFTQNGYKYGYINRDGNIVIEPKYDYAGDFSEGQSFVKKDNISKEWQCIDTKDEILFSIIANYVMDYNGGIAKVYNAKDSIMYLNKQGMFVEMLMLEDPLQKNMPVPFYENTKWGYKIGVVTIIEPVYVSAGDFTDGLAPVFFKFNESDLPEENCYNAFINVNGDIIIKAELKYDDHGYLESGYFYSPGKWQNGVCRYYTSNDPKTSVMKYIRSDGKVIW